MKRFLNILVAVATSICILISTIVPAYATGFQYEMSDDGTRIYNYPIEFSELIITYDMLQQMGLYIVDGSSALEIVYEVAEIIPFNPNGITAESIVAGGSAVAGGGATGVLATISGLSAGQIVLFAALASAGVLLLTEPELVERTLNDVYAYIDHQSKLLLDETYAQETWVLDENIIASINNAITNIVTISNGVVWNDSLVIGANDFSGLTDTYPTGDAPVIENQMLEDLTLPIYQVMTDIWTCIDSNKSIYYNLSPAGSWKDTTGIQYELNPSSKIYYAALLKVYNSATGVQMSFYPSDDGGSAFHYADAGNTTRATYYIAEPIFINDGVTTSVQIPFARKYDNKSYYTYWGQHAQLDRISDTHPLILTGTGTVLDDKLILTVDYNETTGLYDYTYKDVGDGWGNKYYDSISLPMDPFKWVFSSTQSIDNADSSGALKTNISEEYLDDFGKIETNKTVEVPQIKPSYIELPKLDIQANPEANPDDDPEAAPDTETNIWGNIENVPDSNPDSNPGVNPDINPDAKPDLDPMDTTNPDGNKISAWISAVFNLKHLFDWLPEQFSDLFDRVISFMGTVALVMFVYGIFKRFFL